MQESLASRVAEHAPAMLIYLDAELRVRFASRHCYELLGRAPREMLGRLLAELVDPRTLKYALDHVAQLNRGNHAPRDYVLRDREGMARFLKVHAVPDRDPQGRCVGYFACTSDQAAEREARERLRLALAGAQAGIWEWALDGGGAYYSAEFKGLLGYSDAGFPADFAFFAALHPDDSEAVFDAVALAAQEGQAFDREFRMRGADGGYRWLRGVCRVVLDANSDAPTRLVGTAREISARKQAELELHEARALVEVTLDGCLAITQELSERRKLDGVKRELLAAANHDLRTPLASIIAALELVREGAHDHCGESKESFLELALQKAEQLAGAVAQWMDVERVDLGVSGVRDVLFELAEIVAAAVEDRSAFAAERGVRIDRACAAQVQMNGDPERLQRAFALLLAHAINRSPRGAAVRVQLGVRGRRAVLLVEDEGADVFSTTYHGLNACKVMIERQGGSLQVANRAMRGAAFHVELPCA